MSGDERTDAPTVDEKAAVGDEVLWEGEIPSPEPYKPMKRRLVLRYWSLGKVQLTDIEGWKDSDEDAGYVAAHLARRLAAVEAEMAAQVEAAYREGFFGGCKRHHYRFALEDIGWHNSDARARLIERKPNG